MFYIPDNGTDVRGSKDLIWSTLDPKWKSWARFPVYAISGYSGGILVNALSQYSGNLTSVPYGHTLANEFPPESYVRLAAFISVGMYPCHRNLTMS